MNKLKWWLWRKWTNIIIERRVERWYAKGGNVLYHGNKQYWQIHVSKHQPKHGISAQQASQVMNILAEAISEAGRTVANKDGGTE